MTLLDLIGPMQVWSFLPHIDIQYVGASLAPVASDCGASVLPTHQYADAWPDPDVLFVGGAGHPIFDGMEDRDALDFLAATGHRATWVTSVCTGALLLGAAGLLQGYQAATHWAVRERLVEFGAQPSAERVCIDRNRVTGGGITAGIDFALSLAGLWQGAEAGKLVELILEYAPQPPFGTGRPEAAGPTLVAKALEMLRSALPPVES
jgi:cyclohexyl-isocyanide hydratase